MKGCDRLLLLPLALVACACALVVSSITSRASGAPIETGNRRLSTTAAETRARLADWSEHVHVNWYRTPPERMPSHLRGLERDVRAALEAIAEAAGDRFSFAVLDPQAHPEWSDFLGAVGVAPWRARRVERDGWTEQEIWSSLRVTVGARQGAVINGFGPERLAELQRLLLAQVDELRSPRRPVIAIDAPRGFDELRAGIAPLADLREVDFESSARLPEETDLFLWLSPSSCGSEQLRALDELLARGGSAIVAGSRDEAGAPRRTADTFAFELRPSGFPAADFLAHFGLRATPGLPLDPSSASLVELDGREFTAPHRIRAIAPNQDFRAFRGQPNGGLDFTLPTAFEPDAARLAELGLEARILATTTERAIAVDPPAAGLVRADELSALRGTPVGKLALAAALESKDPWRGTLVVLGSASAFRDGLFSDEPYMHRQLASVLFDTLLAPEKLVASRVARAGALPLENLDASQRALWRAIVIALGPVILIALALLRARTGGSRRSPKRRTGLALFGRASLVIAALLILVRAIPDPALDLTREGGRRLSPTQVEALSAWTDANRPLQLELFTSDPARLSPELRARLRGARELCRELARTVPGITRAEREVDASDPSAMAELEELGVGTHLARSTIEESTRLRRVVSALRIVSSEGSLVLELQNAQAFDALRFRIAFALWKLATGGTGRIALVAEDPRISPAEAALEYQRQGLFVPREGQAFRSLHTLLETCDFEVRRLDPAAPGTLEAAELLFWAQPRRDITPMIAALAQHLARGGHAIVAAQHYRLLARQLEREQLALTFWPRPQFCDLDRFYLPELGIELAREVFFDRLSAPLEITTRVDRVDGSSELALQESAQAFLLRAAESNRPPQAEALRGIGDLLFPFGNRIRLDAARLAANGIEAEPWILSSDQPWSFVWKGGDLPASVLEGSAAETEGLLRHDEAQALAVLFRGRFPGARAIIDAQGANAIERIEALREAPPGELLLIGGSEALGNELLHDKDYRHADFVLRATTELALGPELTQFLQGRSAAPGFDYVAPGARSGWRLFVLLAFPLVLSLFVVIRRARP